jgi:ABC-2 type transport system permease protein
MSKLLSANFMRLWKNKCFWGGILFMLIIGAVYPVMKYVQMKRTEYILHLDSGFFSCAVFVSILLSVFCSLFVGTEYSDGTIRNKIIIGHKRMNIYFANLLTNMFVGLMMCAVFFVVYLCIGIPLLGFFETNSLVVLMFAGIVFVLSFAFSSLFTMIAMINSNRAIAAVICILVAFIMLIAGTYINSRLHEPETYPAYSYVEGVVEFSEKEQKNPNYLEGTKRKIYQFLYDFLPGGQVVQCGSMEAENPYMLPVYSAIVFIIITSTGIVIFRRKDLK